MEAYQNASNVSNRHLKLAKISLHIGVHNRMRNTELIFPSADYACHATSI